MLVGGSSYSGPVSIRFPVQVTHGGCAGGTVACTRPWQEAEVDGSCSSGLCKIKGLTDLKLPSDRLANVAIGSQDVGFEQICVYDDAAGQPADPFACPGTYVP